MLISYINMYFKLFLNPYIGNNEYPQIIKRLVQSSRCCHTQRSKSKTHLFVMWPDANIGLFVLNMVALYG